MSNIKFLVMDVDGTLTDGKIYMGNDGEIFKVFDIKDGYAVHTMLKKLHITPVIITGRTSKIVEHRAGELGIFDLYQGVSNKLEQLEQFLISKSHLLHVTYGLDNVAYIGDDLNDIPVMKAIKAGRGIVGAPRNAIDEVKKISDFISNKNGGEGAVRDFIEFLTGK